MRTGDRNCIRSINYKKQDDKSSGWSDLAAAFLVVFNKMDWVILVCFVNRQIWRNGVK